MSSDSIVVCPDMAAAKTRASRRIFLTARWQHLIMLNWPIDPEIVEPLVPRGCELDFHHGKSFVSIVAFLFLDTRLLGIVVPGHRNFAEVNLRFYVRRAVDGEIRRGVVFVKEISPRWAIAQTARLFYNEHFVSVPMQHELDDGAAVSYRWLFCQRWNAIAMRHSGQPMQLAPGSHEEFIAEHYYGYSRQRDGGTAEFCVEHRPWKIWPCSELKLDVDVEANYGPRFASVLAQPPASAFLADGSTVAVTWPTRIC